MDANRWERIQEIYLEVVELPQGERDAALRDRCGDDGELRAEVESLLPFETEGGTLLDASLNDLAMLLGAEDAREIEGSEDEERLPDRIGPYRVIGLLGRGGMGLVYRAERDDDQYDRTVALKLVRGGATDPEARARFRREQRILASLEHRGIARLYDAGVTDDGLPWLAMELVDGEPIHHWCDHRALGVAERLRLFEDVCEAVEYAHRNLVIHRDLKPSNILVTEEGQVKLLDFGIARLVESDDDTDDPLTRAGQRILTPGYSSPEQLRGERLTTGSDVFTLGVVLHRLLTGTVPSRASDEREVTRPSAVVGSAAEDWPEWESTDRLKKALEGDLDTLVMKALRVETGERYESVADLREDLVRWRERRPLQARPQTMGYRASRFVRRNRGAVAGAIMVGLILGLAGVVLIRSEGRAEAEAERAEVEAETATQVSEFLVDLLVSAAPDMAQGEDVTVRQVLDDAVERLATELDDEPRVKVRLLEQLGVTYDQLGLLDQALALLDQATAIDEANPGEVDWETRFYLLRSRAITLQRLARYDEALVSFETAEALLEGRAEVEKQADLSDNIGLIHTNIGNFDEAEARYREAIALDSLLMANDTSTILPRTLNNLAILYNRIGRGEEAIPLMKEALAVRQRTLGDRHPEVANGLVNMGQVLTLNGRPEEGEPYIRESWDLNQDLYAGDHYIIANDIHVLSGNLQAQGRLAESDSLGKLALEMRLRLLGPDHPQTALSYGNLAGTALLLGDTARALDMNRRALEGFRAVYGDYHEYTATIAIRLGRLRMQAVADTVAGLAMYEEGFRWFYEVQGPDSPNTTAVRDEFLGILESWRPAEAERVRRTYPMAADTALGPAG